MKIGRHLTIKVLDASKFTLAMGGESTALDFNPTRISSELDRPVIAGLRRVTPMAGDALATYNHSRVLEIAESFLWTPCDDYLGFVEEHAYNHDSK